MSRPRVAVLLSGRGSNMEALARAAAGEHAPYEIVLVLANRPEAEGLVRAQALGLATAAIDHRPFGPDREAHERTLDAALRNAGAEWIALAGYMRVLTPMLVTAWAGRMLNVHPSLLPLFPGLNTHERALQAGVKLHGCTVHLVTEGVDAGPILGQAAVPVLAGDTPGSLAARVQVAEHRLYPACVIAAVSGFSPGAGADDVLLNPPA